MYRSLAGFEFVLPTGTSVFGLLLAPAASGAPGADPVAGEEVGLCFPFRTRLRRFSGGRGRSVKMDFTHRSRKRGDHRIGGCRANELALCDEGMRP
jgi:hypothetical protein